MHKFQQNITIPTRKHKNYHNKDAIKAFHISKERTKMKLPVIYSKTNVT